MRSYLVRSGNELFGRLLAPLILTAAASLALLTVRDVVLAQPSQVVFGVSISVLLLGLLAELHHFRRVTAEALRASARREAAASQIARRCLEDEDLDALLDEVAALVAWALDVNCREGRKELWRRRTFTAGDREFLEAVAWIMDGFIARRARRVTAKETSLVHPSSVD